MVAGPISGHRSGGRKPSLGFDSDRSAQRRIVRGRCLADSHRNHLGALGGEPVGDDCSGPCVARTGEFLALGRAHVVVDEGWGDGMFMVKQLVDGELTRRATKACRWAGVGEGVGWAARVSAGWWGRATPI